MTTKVHNAACSAAPGASRADLSTESSIGQPPRGRSRYRRSRVPVEALPTLLAAAGLSACVADFPFELDRVVVISLLLESGERSAKMVASHPLPDFPRRDQAPLDISASLEGPGWTVAFAATDPMEECGPPYGASTCLSAQLPEAVAPGMYRVRGTTPLGSFSGEATVPAIPSIENPAGDTLWIHSPDDTAGDVLIPLEYRVDPKTTALFLEVTFEHEGRQVSRRRLLELGDSIYGWYEEGEIWPRGLRLRLQALGPRYTSWLRHVGLHMEPPWPSFGIESDAVYGYFDGISAPTRWVDVVAESDT